MFAHNTDSRPQRSGGKNPQASQESNNQDTHPPPQRRRFGPYLSDLREGGGGAGFTLAASTDPGSTGFQRHRPLPEAAADWLRVCARSRMPSHCIRSMREGERRCAGSASGIWGLGFRRLGRRPPMGRGCAGQGQSAGGYRPAWSWRGTVRRPAPGTGLGRRRLRPATATRSLRKPAAIGDGPIYDHEGRTNEERRILRWICRVGETRKTRGDGRRTTERRGVGVLRGEAASVCWEGRQTAARGREADCWEERRQCGIRLGFGCYFIYRSRTVICRGSWWLSRPYK